MQSNAIHELATALAKAQGEIKSALKDATNPFFKSHYADLTSVWNAAREALNKNGLSIVQTVNITDTERGPVLTTTLLHTSGQWIEGNCPLINQKGDMQGLGSAISYARRYSIAAICGVVTEDDDGNAAVEKPKEAAWKPPQVVTQYSPSPGDIKSPHKLITEKQAKMVYAKCKALGMSNETMKKFLSETAGVFNTDHIAADKFDLVLAKLDQTVTDHPSTWDMK